MLAQLPPLMIEWVIGKQLGVKSTMRAIIRKLKTQRLLSIWGFTQDLDEVKKISRTMSKNPRSTQRDLVNDQQRVDAKVTKTNIRNTTLPRFHFMQCKAHSPAEASPC